MAVFAEFKDFVKKVGYGSSQYNNINGETVYLSKGVREVYLADEPKEQDIINMVSRFQKKDFGDAAEFGKESRPGHEYGHYACPVFEDAAEDTGVWVHRTEDAIKVYFGFER